MCRILPFAPFYLINFFLDFKRFEVVKLRFVGLELGVELVLAALLLLSGESECPERLGYVTDGEMERQDMVE